MIEPKAWQHRRLWPLASDPAGKIYLWEGTTKDEATGHFERQPGYEYRALYPQSVIDALQAENERLRAALQEIHDLPGEINTSNYDHDDACELNRQFCYGASIARQALEASHD